MAKRRSPQSFGRTEDWRRLCEELDDAGRDRLIEQTHAEVNQIRQAQGKKPYQFTKSPGRRPAKPPHP